MATYPSQPGVPKGPADVISTVCALYVGGMNVVHDEFVATGYTACRHLDLAGHHRDFESVCVVSSGIPNGVVGYIIQYHTCLVPPETHLCIACSTDLVTPLLCQAQS